jgi:single-stranded-DNA-specific exonuclease
LPKEWVSCPSDPELRDSMASELGIPRLVAQVLINRGLRTVHAARSFLWGNERHDPFLLAGMGAACDRIGQALQTNEVIGVYGDYDVDGLTGTALLTRALRTLGGKVIPRVPHRLEEGYGLCPAALQELADMGVRLVVTVDNGITAGPEEIAMAREKGMDLIITDHHEVPAAIPDVCAVINPKQPDCPYPEKELAGVGLAYKLAAAVAGQKAADLYLDLVALGTVADVVPLQGENRILAKEGLALLPNSSNRGLATLLTSLGLDDGSITAGQVGFVIGPRLNAVGRLDDSQTALELLLCDDSARARELVMELETYNRERQAIEARILRQAQSLVEEEHNLDQDRALVLAHENWHPGVIGIVASRLVEMYHRPVILIALDGPASRGSGRSIPGFNLYAALQACGDLLTKYGGHEMAAGLTIHPDMVPLLRHRLNEVAVRTLEDSDLVPSLRLDGWVSLDELTLPVLRQLDGLQPFGMANPAPVFAVQQVQVLHSRRVGQEGKHLRLLVKDPASGLEVSAIGFRMGDLEGCLSRHCLVDLAFRPTINHWESREEVQLELRDIRPASQMPLLASRQVSASLLREPVELVDARHVQDKRAYLARLREAGERPLIVVNSPKEAASLAEQLIAFGAEGRGPLDDSPLAVAAAYPPAAFPEGFTTVVLWDLPLAPIQLRWTLGEKTHLLFNSQDGPRTQGLRDDVLPTRERLALVYRSLRDEWSYGETFSQEEAWRLPDLADADPLMVSMALSIFQEVGLLRREGGSFALVKPPAGKVDLTLSMLYNESRISPGEFRRFSNFLLTAPIHDLQAYCQGYRKETPDGSKG